MQRASQSLNAVTARQTFRDADCIAKLRDCMVRLAAQMRTAGKPPEDHGLAVALRLIQPGENALEDIGRLAYLTVLKQALATPAFGDIPTVRVLCLLSHCSTNPESVSRKSDPASPDGYSDPQ